LGSVLALWLLGGCAAVGRHETPPELRSIPDLPTQSAVPSGQAVEVGGRPAFRLADGRLFALQRRVDGATPDWFDTEPPRPPPRHLCGRSPYPTSVSLQANLTPVQDQGGRDTCTVFAFTAAVEAAYRRLHGVSVKLSEQYLNHVQKSHWLNGAAPLPGAEIQPEINGGGNLHWHAAVLGRYGIPGASKLPYVGSGNYQDGAQPGDVPFGIAGPAATQRELDDFNLSDVPTTYAIPEPLTMTVWPQAALEDARYRPTSVTFASAAELGSLDWYRSQLACGREVAILFDFTSGSDVAGVWQPGPAAPGQHAMLIAGYDDGRDAFLVKNSWGGTSLIWFGYEWARRGLIREAAVILAVAPPGRPFGVFDNPQLFLGRWNLDHDGWRGLLDIYRLPRPPGSSDPDLRVGTYFGPDGQPRRVNATIEGNRIDFVIDWDHPDLSVSALQGLRFTGYLFSWQPGVLAGTMLDNRDGRTYAFHATKRVAWAGTGNALPVDFSSYLGSWAFDHDGWNGQLDISGVHVPTRRVQGTYRSPDGRAWTLGGTIDPDMNHFNLEIPFAGGPQSFRGALYGHEAGLGAGTTTWGGIPFGFVMVRRGDLAPPPARFVYHSANRAHWRDVIPVGERGDETVTAGVSLPSTCLLQDIVLELVERDGTVRASTRLGEPGGAVWNNAGASITSQLLGTNDTSVNVHWWFDPYTICRYRIRYEALGSGCP
jgi:hypothetical protein